ncbi:MAG: tetratricopeptide repeat protein [Sphingopyxis sp.]|nr:tetratricopeptide repeat protein [Sphingopyxis sp.]
MPDRIDGWKSIGAYFGRDRTTAIRWARERDLPVHRLPGGKTATVYALRDELAAWAQSRSRETDAAALEALSSGAPSLTSRRGLRLALGGLACLAAIGGGWLAMPLLTPAAPAAISVPALPRESKVAADFLAGRDLLVDREAGSIERAITLLAGVTRDDPGYGPGYVALAEALILSREFGIRGDRDAFPEARAAARDALRLSPGLASSHRVNGFVAYWWDRDFDAANAYFNKAVALDPNDANGHFWFGNILADHGDSRRALDHLNKARGLLPGSVAIQTDLAWAQWSAGDTDTALATLTDLERRHPDFAVIHDCLSVIRLANADYAGFIAGQQRVARLRRNPALSARIDDVSEALSTSEARAHQVLIAQANADLASGDLRSRAWPSFLHSVAGDRDALIGTMKIAAERREQWGDAGFVRAIRARWRGDGVVEKLLDIVAPGAERRPRGAT